MSTALHTGSHLVINSLKPKEGSRSKIRGAKPRQLVCKQVILAVSMSVSPAEIIAKSTRTLSSCGPKENQISLYDANANERIKMFNGPDRLHSPRFLPWSNLILYCLTIQHTREKAILWNEKNPSQNFSDDVSIPRSIRSAL